MRIVILTSHTREVASRVLPELCKNKNLEVAAVVLVQGQSPNRKRFLKRKLKKVCKIGLLGTLNGIRMREWFIDSDAPDLRELCNTFDVPIHETPFVGSSTTKELFKQFEADIGLSLGNGYIPSTVFSLPKYGMLNIHTELLPQFQGANSIIWPIYEGVQQSGFTIHQIEKKIDKGDILFQEKYDLEFFPTLEETVKENLKRIRLSIPRAFSYVCENYISLKADAKVQPAGKSYTTPTYFQYLRMVKNHRRMYRESQGMQ